MKKMKKAMFERQIRFNDRYQGAKMKKAMFVERQIRFCVFINADEIARIENIYQCKFVKWM